MRSRLPTSSILEVIDRIVSKNQGIAEFWGTGGWAPLEAAGLLSRSRLDRQVSLSRTLSLFVRPAATASTLDADGKLILGWTNLGSLVEGSLKWFLSVYFQTYQADINALRDLGGDVRDPDGATLEPLRVFFQRSVWTSSDNWDTWVREVQQRRNAIHSYKHRDIGTLDELEASIRVYYDFIQELDGRVPYPDEVYRP